MATPFQVHRFWHWILYFEEQKENVREETSNNCVRSFAKFSFPSLTEPLTQGVMVYEASLKSAEKLFILETAQSPGVLVARAKNGGKPIRKGLHFD